MLFEPTKLAGAHVIKLEPRGDDRGSFARVFCVDEFREAGLCTDYVQVNHAKNKLAGIIRGMHWQYPPHAEVKLVRCVKGRVYDVIVDIRKGSPTFLEWIGVELSEDNDTMIYVPEGFAHGYQVLEPDSDVTYQVSARYAPGSEGGLRYDDPRIGIEWKATAEPVQTSEKDARAALVDDGFAGVEL